MGASPITIHGSHLQRLSGRTSAKLIERSGSGLASKGQKPVDDSFSIDSP